jgi:hypothetical protein
VFDFTLICAEDAWKAKKLLAFVAGPYRRGSHVKKVLVFETLYCWKYSGVRVSTTICVTPELLKFHRQFEALSACVPGVNAYNNFMAFSNVSSFLCVDKSMRREPKHPSFFPARVGSAELGMLFATAELSRY